VEEEEAWNKEKIEVQKGGKPIRLIDLFHLDIPPAPIVIAPVPISNFILDCSQSSSIYLSLSL
jgi:hypothetical protein